MEFRIINGTREYVEKELNEMGRDKDIHILDVQFSMAMSNGPFNTLYSVLVQYRIDATKNIGGRYK